MVMIVLLIILDVFYADIIKGNLFIVWALLLALCLVASVVIEFIIKRNKKNE